MIDKISVIFQVQKLGEIESILAKEGVRNFTVYQVQGRGNHSSLIDTHALNTHYQWWSKAGGGPGYSNQIPKELYIQNFNWLSNWIDRYFFNKMSDFLLGLLFVMVVFVITFKSKKRNSNLKNFKKNSLYYFLIILLLVEWFLNHPSLRYGGYIIFSLIYYSRIQSNF